tara:strand:+ start:3892 stop:5271 length:1380 start_codon:yes stop_codon:yes gene_type:complete
MAEARDMNNIVVRSETVYDASHWGEENVYIFPPNYKTPRGCIWVIPPVSHTDFDYKDNPGFPGQHFAYDYIMDGIQRGDIPQDDWLIVILHSHETSVERGAWNAKEMFKEKGFNYAKHINLCGCCTDDKDKPFENVVIAMGSGAQSVDFLDPTITSTVLIDPALYPPLEIPDDVLPTIAMVSNTNNFDTTTEGGQNAVDAIGELEDALGDNATSSDSKAFNHYALAAAMLGALNFDGDGGVLDSMSDPGPTVCYRKANDTGGFDSQEVEDEETGDITIEYAATSNIEEAWTDERGLPIEMECPDTPDGDAKDAGNTTVPTDEKPGKSDPPPTTPTQGGGEFAGPQVIITSDRLLFNAKNDSVLISAGTHIGLSALEAVGIDAGNHFTVNTPNIYLGLGAQEPLVLGNELEQWLEGLLDAISRLTYTNAGGPTGPAVNIAILESLRAQLPSVKSPQNYTL